MGQLPFVSKPVYDFLGSFDGGMDGGTEPLLLQPNQLAYAENVTVRGNFPSTRPGFQKKTLTFGGGIQAAFEQGRFQGCCYLKPANSILGGSTLDSLIVSIDGRLYRISISGDTCSVSEFSPSPANPATADIAWMWQAEAWVIIQDGQSLPVIYDGDRNSASRSNPGTPGTIVPGQKLIIASTQPIVNQDGSIAGGSTDHVVYPPQGKTCVVNLTSLYTGDYNIQLDNFWQPSSGQQIQFGSFKILPFDPGNNPPVVAANCKLTNVNDTVGNTTTLIAGAQVLITQTQSQLVPFARVNSWGKSGGTYVLSLSNAIPATTSVQILGTYYVVPPGDVGTTTLHITTALTIDFSGATVSYQQTTTTQISIGTIQPPSGAPYTSPAVGADVAVNLSTAYNGTDGVSVTINGKGYTIKKYTQVPGGNPSTTWPNLVILENVDAPPTDDHGLPHWFYNELRGSPPVASNSSYLVTPSSTVPGTAVTGIPTGRMGVYGMGRNWVCLADGRSYWASDLVGDPSGTLANNLRDAVLQSQENSYLAGGGVWVVPSSGEVITAMIFTALLDTSLGQGPQAIMTPKQVFTNQAPVDRTQWQNLNNPLQTVGLISNGALGHYSTISVNGDTIFRSVDGIRSYILARRDFDVWGNVPISHEVSEILDLDDISLLPHGSAVVFANRMMMTANPLRDPTRSHVYHTKLVVLNMDPLSSLRGKEPSVWDGVWTGMNILQVVKGDFAGTERCFAFVYNTSTQKIELHEIGSDRRFLQDDLTTGISSSIRTGAKRFQQEQPLVRNFLRLIDGEIIVNNLIADTTFSAYYRPDQYSDWVLWRTFTVTLQGTNEKGFRPRLGLGEPPDTDMDTVINRPLREAYSFEFRLDADSYYTLLGARFKAIQIPEPEFEPPS